MKFVRLLSILVFGVMLVSLGYNLQTASATPVETGEPDRSSSQMQGQAGPAVTGQYPQAVLYDNGPFITHPGGGSGGADASVLQSALDLTIYGFTHSPGSGFRIADDFTITGAGWMIDQITFFAYQTGSDTDCTMDHLNYQIWDGPPGDAGSTVVFGDTTTNRLTSCSWTSAYRVLDEAMTATNRPVMANLASAGILLQPGTYWLDWQAGGTLASGPYAVPITILGQVTTGNGLQWNPSLTLWEPLLDTGTGTQQGLPFVIEGTAALPVIVVDPLSISITLSVDETGNAPVTISNEGGADLEVTGILETADWLTAPFAATILPGESEVVTFTFDTTGLAEGVYVTTATVVSNDVNVDVEVTLTVTAPESFELYMPTIFDVVDVP